MSWLTLRPWQTLLGGLAIASCSSLSSAPPPPPDPVYDVGSAVVVSGPGISPELLTATGDRVNAAIAATTRDTVLPRVVLTIRVVNVQKGQGFNKDRNVAKVNIDATSVESGSVVAVSSFETTSFASDPTMADDLMAEDIAARIRSIFILKTPPLAS